MKYKILSAVAAILLLSPAFSFAQIGTPGYTGTAQNVATTWTSLQTFRDNTFKLTDNSTVAKIGYFELSGLASGTNTFNLNSGAAGTFSLLSSSLATNAPNAANSIWGGTNGLVFEGATANNFETSITVVDPTSNQTFTLPNYSGTALISVTANAPDLTASVWAVAGDLVFEGATVDNNDTTLSAGNPTTANTVTIPNKSGTILLSTDYPLNHDYYVDGGRADSYTPDGSQSYPYLTVKAATDAINIDAAAHAAAGHYELTNYVVHIAAGTYSDALTLNNEKYVRLEGAGVILSGTIAFAQSQQSGDYYSRVEFVGVGGFRAEKGPAMTISGAMTGTRNNDSLTYMTFRGVYVTGAFTADTDGTWVIYYDHCRVTGTIDTGTLATADAGILLEANETEFANSITDKVAIYTGLNSSFTNMTTTPWYHNSFVNCTFSGTISIIPQGGAAETVTYVDPISRKSLIARAPTLTGGTLSDLGQTFGASIVFDGTTANAFETTITATDPTADNAISIPDASGTMVLSTNFKLNHEFYVDGGRTDTYTPNGTEMYPFLTVDAALDVINADAVTHAGLGEYLLTNYTVHVAAGTYSDALTFNNEKYVRIEGAGVTLSGTIAFTQSQQSGDYYSRVEFVGVDGFRAEKGPALTISGAMTATRNNDSLTYLTFKGVYVASGGTFTATGDGTWVVQFFNSRVSSTIDANTLATADAGILLESDWTEFAGTIQNEVALYNVTNTEFWGTINTTPWYSNTFKDTGFHGTVSIVPQAGAAESTLYVDPVSYKSLAARNPTLTGVTLVETGTFDNAIANSNSFPLIADAVIQYGSTVMPDAGTDGRFDATTGSATLSIGILQGTGASAQGTTYNLVHNGLARVLPASDQAVTRGHYLLQSSTAGRVDDSATVSTDGLNIAKALYSEPVTYNINPTGCTGGNGCINTALNTPNSGPAGQITLDTDVAALGWVAGQPVVYYDSGGNAPTGLTDGNVYWLLSVSTTNVTIAATKGGAVVVPSDQGDDGTQYLLRLPLSVVSIQ